MAAVVLLATAATGLPSASAAPGAGGPGGQVKGGSSDGVLTAEVTVTITGSAVGNGGTSSGGTSGGGTVTVRTPVACFWSSLDGAYTGADMYQRYLTTPQEWTLSPSMYLPSVKEVEKHKADDGLWYYLAPGPRSDLVDIGQWDAATASCMGALQASGAAAGANGGLSETRFVPTGTQPPAAPPVPPTPEQMRDAALKALTLPIPTMTRNPANLTIVNIDTWFSVPGAQFREWDVTASAGQPVTSATVTATPAGMALVAGGSVVSRCEPGQAVSAYAAGSAADAGCTYAFPRSSIAQPALKYLVQGVTTYDTAWTSVVAGGAGPGGALEAQVRTGETNVPVAESQAVVTGSG